MVFPEAFPLTDEVVQHLTTDSLESCAREDGRKLKYTHNTGQMTVPSAKTSNSTTWVAGP